MNTHEAIKILLHTAWLGSDGDREKIEQAIEVVAEALEQEPSCRNTRQVDLISRADLQELFNETTTSLMDKIEQKDIEHFVRACVMVTEMIQDAPSVVPKGSDEEWK